MTSIHKTIDDITQHMDQFAPTRLAEDWDNVGLLTGDRQARCERIMTCLTVTPESAQEAIEGNAELIVTHHPLPFHPFRRLTTDQVPSRILWNLTRAGIAIYSPHTSFDSASKGINFTLAGKLGLQDIQPLLALPDEPAELGTGRVGSLAKATRLSEFLQNTKSVFDMNTLKYVGDPSQPISKVAVACGSGGSFLNPAIEAGCDCFVTGEADFHSCLEAKANATAVVLLGHYTSERFAVEYLANHLRDTFPQLEIWASRQESDPTQFA